MLDCQGIRRAWVPSWNGGAAEQPGNEDREAKRDGESELFPTIF